MWKKGRTLAACVLAAAWWSLFYPELCFTEETCRVVQTAEEGTDGRNEATPDGNADNAGKDAAVQGDTAVSGILRAGEDEVVVSDRLLEWCEEKALDGKK